MRFFHGVTLGHGEIPERISYARERRKPPVVLSADEVVGLKVGNIDSERMVIRVQHGKDRSVMLSPELLTILRTYWRLARPEHWLFPGHDASKPLDVQVLHAAYRSARSAPRSHLGDTRLSDQASQIQSP